MKIVQTLFIKKDALKNTFGWARQEFHLMSWALSCLQLKHIYKNVELFANTQGTELLIDTLKLPYSDHHMSHDNLDLPNDNLWALPKIFTYSLQTESFLHIDGDVFLFNQLPDSLFGKALIAQNIEEATEYYQQTQQQLVSHFSYFPKCVRNDFNGELPIKAINAGIIGGNNLDFIKEYTRLAFKYVRKNIQHLSQINVDRFNVFFEQHLFYSLAKEKGMPISVLFPEKVKDNQYMHLGDIHEVPCNRSYIHLLGQYKRDEFTCRQMAAKLRMLYPEYYYRIISLFRKSTIPLYDGINNNHYQTTLNDYINFSSNAKKHYETLNCCKATKIAKQKKRK